MVVSSLSANMIDKKKKPLSTTRDSLVAVAEVAPSFAPSTVLGFDSGQMQSTRSFVELINVIGAINWSTFRSDTCDTMWTECVGNEWLQVAITA